METPHPAIERENDKNASVAKDAILTVIQRKAEDEYQRGYDAGYLEIVKLAKEGLNG